MGSPCHIVKRLDHRHDFRYKAGEVIMQPVTSSQAKYLRGLAHGLKAVVFVGQKGITPAVLDAARDALNAHELIKVKFIDFKDRKQKAAFATDIECRADCVRVGMIGHVVLFYRPHPDPEKRKIVLPIPSKDSHIPGD
jgi:RNA-binding protein